MKGFIDDPCPVTGSTCVYLLTMLLAQLIDYFGGHIVFWEMVEENLWQFYDQ